jgi:FkbM family methyltransferase
VTGDRWVGIMAAALGTFERVLRRYVAVLRRQKQPFRFLISRALMYSRLSTRIVIQKRGFRLRFYPTNASAQQWVDPYHLHDANHGYREETFLRRYLRPGDVVVDVGANFGLTALAAWSVVGPMGEIHAFEPHPRIFSFLLGNIELNGAKSVIKAYNVALGDTTGSVYLTDYRADDQNAISQNRTCVRVPMSTLDQAISARKHIALLKIDVEGFEKFVLEGAKHMLTRVDCVYFESYDPNFARYGYALGDIVDLLTAQGLDVRRIGPGHSTTLVTAAETDMQPDNLLAVRDLEHLRRRLQSPSQR